MKIHIKVKEAIAHYNRVEKPKNKMTLASLGKIVFSGDSRIKSDSTREQYLSSWNNGFDENKAPTVMHCALISKATGFPLCDLVIIED